MPSSPDEAYELIELAPQLFLNIRNIQNVNDSHVKKVFSVENIQNLDIKISSGKGGSFFIQPVDGGRLLIKSITKPELLIIQNFLPTYYQYLLMNPNTYLCPILGVYQLKLQQAESIPPISFILMRNVLDIDPSKLSSEDKVLCFDLKGSISGR